MSALSRRTIVTSAAALPALAVPAVAVAAWTEPDPPCSFRQNEFSLGGTHKDGQPSRIHRAK